MHVVTLIRRTDGSGEPHRDFPGLAIRSYEDDGIEFIEIVVLVIGTWIVAFYASDFLFTDYELVGVEEFEKGNHWHLAGKLEPWSDAPPELPHPPIRYAPLSPWHLPPLRHS